ncbi:MAG: TetR/AcrR family transcriptional regulator [Pseudomonadota bacterium]
MQRARSESDKTARRRRLVAAALDEFYERGFTAARMEDIAGRADLSKGTLYLYFSSKEDLFRALIDEYALPNLNTLEMISRTGPSLGAALSAIATFAPQVIRHSNLPKLLKVLIGDSQNFPGIVRTYREEVIDRGLAAVSALLQRAHDAGEIEIDDPALTARLVIAPMVLSIIWQAVFAHTDKTPIDLDTLFRMHVDHLKRALSYQE